ncbi:hypothetical protein A2U01_0068834, partial [Trifolium medium]|nr:hypothetical protein [Trifolium medium]
QHLAREISSIKEEQARTIELRNRKVEVVEKPKKDRKISEAGNNPAKEALKNTSEEETGERMELTAEDEPTVKGKPKSTPIQPSAYTTEEPQATVAPYPPKYEKK